MARYSAEEVAKSREVITRAVNERWKVYVTIPSVSRSGMSRTMKFEAARINSSGEIVSEWLTFHIARVYGATVSESDSIRVRGTGMDMIFHVLYTCASLCGFDFKSASKFASSYELI